MCANIDLLFSCNFHSKFFVNYLTQKILSMIRCRKNLVFHDFHLKHLLISFVRNSKCLDVIFTQIIFPQYIPKWKFLIEKFNLDKIWVKFTQNILLSFFNKSFIIYFITWLLNKHYYHSYSKYFCIYRGIYLNF